MTPQEKARRESVIEKVRKLLALAAEEGGGTPAERELAERRAAEIMTRHDIAMFDVEDADKGAVGRETDAIDGMTEQWKGRLAGRICESMGGDYFYTSVSRARARWTLVGRPDTIAFARMLSATLVPWLEAECAVARTAAVARGERGVCSRCDGEGYTRREKGGGYSTFDHECPTCYATGRVPLNARVFNREFYNAATNRIALRLREQRRATADEVRGTGSGTELVRNDRAAIDRYYKDSGIKLHSVSAGSTGGAAAGRAAGRDAGGRAALAPTRSVSTGRGALPRGRS
jgi:hypothetical protein